MKNIVLYGVGKPEMTTESGNYESCCCVMYLLPIENFLQLHNINTRVWLMLVPRFQDTLILIFDAAESSKKALILYIL